MPDTLTCEDLPEVADVPARVPHWEKPIRKTIYTLCVNDYAPRIRELTFPLMRDYARKIGADFHVITERKFPEWPVTYEKLQIYELARGARSHPVNISTRTDGEIWTRVQDPSLTPPEWNIFIDADTLINPEMFDVTEHLSKDTVAHNGKDFAGIRWKYDQYFRRDGRHWGSCNWFTIASDWCLDIWRPLDDLTPEEAIARINITTEEYNSGCCKPEHLIDDYTLSRNIARFGLKATTIRDIQERVGIKDYPNLLWHVYTMTEEEKLKRMLAVLSTPIGEIAVDHTKVAALKQRGAPDDLAVKRSAWGPGWGLMDPKNADELRKKWGLAQ